MASTIPDPSAQAAAPPADQAGRVEAHGDFISDAERHGRARELFAVRAAPHVSYLTGVRACAARSPPVHRPWPA
ncbi:hypothetical protein [Streptomyces sp. NBC_01378]|uniref:hypothetical protein n=1 Tax=Streptomyces sp. NBC_01378 TaxID=2903844 RepID=UPI0038678FF2